MTKPTRYDWKKLAAQLPNIKFNTIEVTMPSRLEDDGLWRTLGGVSGVMPVRNLPWTTDFTPEDTSVRDFVNIWTRSIKERPGQADNYISKFAFARKRKLAKRANRTAKRRAKGSAVQPRPVAVWVNGPIRSWLPVSPPILGPEKNGMVTVDVTFNQFNPG